jgi:hypothetical protein
MRAATSFRAQELALSGSETVLLVDDRESKVRELHVLFDQGVRPDDERAVP